MKITQAKRGAWIVLSLSGRIDHNGADELEFSVLPLMTGGSVALDFTGVDYVTSSCFRVLMRAERDQADKKGRFVIGNLNPRVRQVFDLAGLTAAFKVVPDVHTVVNAR